MSEMANQEARENLNAVVTKISAAAGAAGRPDVDVKLIAVSKKQPDDRVAAVLAAGQRVFGENRVQEAMKRWGPLRQRHIDLELHLIGPLQSNKTKEAVALFDFVHTVDRPKIAAALAREFDAQDRRLGCYIEINTGEEQTKSGVFPGDADGFIAQCRDEFDLPLIGLMCIPPVADEAALHFSLLRDIADRNGLARLSVGMSSDYEKAIRHGATDVRVGTAIFGERIVL